MTPETAVHSLLQYGIDTGLVCEDDRIYTYNRLLETLRLDSCDAPREPLETALIPVLEALCDDAVRRGLIEDNIIARDLFDTAVMGCMTPPPGQVRALFAEKYRRSPRKATDWYFQFSKNTNYIRTDRIAKNICWKSRTEYGLLDVTVNLSKPEKPTTSLAAFKAAKNTGYPKCLLCVENEGYAGRYNHPARQNHRIIPMTLAGQQWYLQYSPYSYYNEHCIALSEEHYPMRIDREAVVQLLDFVTLFPHYFMGSNADLPIVGGSIFSHAHFQGGNYCFAMDRAPVETKLVFRGYESVTAGIVRWPLSTVRLECEDRETLTELAVKILNFWRGYSDPSVNIFAETNGEPHNTITPIARKKKNTYMLHLVLRNNLTTEQYPLGLYHPHPELHHIKKENIGLIEVMGLAVLPARLKPELDRLRELLIAGGDPAADPLTEKHAPWAAELRKKYTFTADNAESILKKEVGVVFAKVLEHCGVFARTPEGKAAFLRFIDGVNHTDE